MTQVFNFKGFPFHVYGINVRVIFVHFCIICYKYHSWNKTCWLWLWTWLETNQIRRWSSNTIRTILFQAKIINVLVMFNLINNHETTAYRKKNCKTVRFIEDQHFGRNCNFQRMFVSLWFKSYYSILNNGHRSKWVDDSFLTPLLAHIQFECCQLLNIFHIFKNTSLTLYHLFADIGRFELNQREYHFMILYSHIWQSKFGYQKEERLQVRVVLISPCGLLHTLGRRQT